MHYLLIYRCFMLLMLPLLLIHNLLKSGFTGSFWRERLGFFSRSTNRTQRVVWLHAVSLGEMRALLPLTDVLLETSDVDIHLSTTTATGRAAATKYSDAKNNARLTVSYLPYDVACCVKRAVDFVKPTIFASFEAEIWPELIHQLKLKNVKVGLVNSRISANAFNRYQRSQVFTKTFGLLDLVTVRSTDDSERLASIGAKTSNIQMVGDIRFDMQVAATDTPLLSKQPRPVVAFASTHDIEASALLSAYQQLQALIPDVLIVWVPRHPEMFDKVHTLLTGHDIAVTRYSTMHQSDQLTRDTSVFLVDAMGILADVYSMADIAVVAGSFDEIGGHNVLEPAALGKPIITGPYYANFEEAVSLLLSAGAIEICAHEELAQTLFSLLQDSTKTDAMGRAAKGVFDSRQGAARRNAEALLALDC